jgi:predicted PurR-regulated permease PerM
MVQSIMTIQKVEISYKTIVFTIAFLLGLWILWSVRDILLLLFLCLIFMEALNPTISKMEKFKIPRPVAIIMVYILVIAVFSFALAGMVPILVTQTSELIRILPGTLQNFQFFGISAVDLSSQFKLIETLPADIAKTILSLFSNIFSGFVVLVITFYLLLERRHLNKYSLQISGNKGQAIIVKIADQLEDRLGRWVNGELLLMTIIGVLSYAGYLFVGLPYALPLAIIAGLLEIVPNIGPIVTTGLAILIGFTVSPLTALFAFVWGIFVHQSENNFITPKIMKETVGLNPVVTILVIATGAKLGGIGGALLAVPIYLTIETITRVLLGKK